ncbi:NAD-dependent epimerase/dehydratase family protein [Pseudomonas sp. SWRI74]|jgi:nucleoside-diphosphate-sugar epimerase|uniref:NAD-dependent epimerase/dehydratase family protein n=1 Tax=Pseudomonas azerbaijanoccidentalis TaxID=2842347 RepID=A0ABS6QY72_9PSED|nr:NAD-dependent epimerase/dehydratase family protein [Pseudomonas azerbaijanoccidentalis]MBV4523854.1 NAD-dependent epimerase/dehydratase family protein [Pseudomonas azerbaijanoccidentalis]
MIFIVGGRGRLGQALREEYKADEVVCVERAVYQQWGASDSLYDITAYFQRYAQPGAVVYICSGLLDSTLASETLHNVNFRLPRNIIQAVSPMGIRAVTFGTAMEGMLTANSYVQSKLALSRFVSEMSGELTPALHIRIHTLYGGGEPSPFMFLGLIMASLRDDKPFAMTLGRQLREYHHVSDDAAAVRALVDYSSTGVVELSHGQPVTLKALAEAVFESAGKGHLLQLGALPEPQQENFTQVFTRSSVLEGVMFRDAVAGVVEYINTLVES